MPLPYEFELDDSRLSLLEKIKPGDACVEIGVFKGDFSECIIKMDPSKLHLIDPWDSIMDVPARWHATSQEEMNSIKQEVVDKFSSNPKVSIIEKYSVDALDDFADESLDWVYLDANHSYSFVVQDLSNWWEKIKPGGFICGNAYQDDNFHVEVLDFGVIEAVGSFTEDSFDSIEDFEVFSTQFLINKSI